MRDLQQRQVTGKRMRPDPSGQKITHEIDQVRVWILFDITSQLSPRHPLGHQLEGFECNADEGYNVGVAQTLPRHGLLAK